MIRSPLIVHFCHYQLLWTMKYFMMETPDLYSIFPLIHQYNNLQLYLRPTLGSCLGKKKTVFTLSNTTAQL